MRRSERSFLRFRRLFPTTDNAIISRALDAAILWKEQLKSYHSLLKSKREFFWRNKVESQRNSPRALWKSIDSLMGRGVSFSSCLSAQDLHDHFYRKVADVRLTTENSAPPSFQNVPMSCPWSQFAPVTPQSINEAILTLSNKFSPSDPLPIKLLKNCSDILSPFIAFLFNLSFSSGVFPSAWKFTTITPTLKKGMTDSSSPTSFRPIAKLSHLSKLIERIVSAQLRCHLNSHNLLPLEQSAYRPFHSTESAVLKVTSDIFQTLDHGNLSLMSFLDFTAAFDTVDLDILCRRLSTSFGIQGRALDWIFSFVNNRPHNVVFASSSSLPTVATCGIPQGSVLGPLLFILYVHDIPAIVKRHNLNLHMYADDVVIYGSTSPSSVASLTSRISHCLDDVITWCGSNRLLLNSKKSQFLWCSSRPRSSSIPVSPIRIGLASVLPVTHARFLGVILDSHLSFTKHISNCVSSCFAMLRQIRSIRKSVSHSVLKTLVSSLIIPRIDYCISALSGVPSSQICRLQSIMNAAARVLFGASRFSAVTPFLQDLEWLPISHRIDFRLALLVLSCRLHRAPHYLSSEVDFLACADRPNLRSTNNGGVLQPRIRHPTLGGRSFHAAAARVWNSLPTHLRMVDNPCVFKSCLKLTF